MGLVSAFFSIKFISLWKGLFEKDEEDAKDEEDEEDPCNHNKI